MPSARVLRLAAPQRPPTRQERVVYELARLRIADLREPPPRFAHLARPRD